MIDVVASVLGVGFVSTMFVLALLYGFIEIVGKLYATYRVLVRADLTSEQRIIYLVIIWFIPLGWLIYLILGTEKTQQLFADVEIF